MVFLILSYCLPHIISLLFPYCTECLEFQTKHFRRQNYSFSCTRQTVNKEHTTIRIVKPIYLKFKDTNKRLRSHLLLLEKYFHLICCLVSDASADECYDQPSAGDLQLV